MINELQTIAQQKLNKIIAMPFVTELASGELERNIFSYYLQQDYLYLKDFSSCLFLAAKKCKNKEYQQWLINSANHVIEEEQAMQEVFFSRFNVIKTRYKNLACFSYTNYILSIAKTNDAAVVISSLLPCFWIYEKTGAWLKENSGQNNPYQQWIDNYHSEEFSASVRVMEALLRDLINEPGQKNDQAIKEVFTNSCELEFSFWQSSYHREDCLFLT